MRAGTALFKWAQDKASEAGGKDTGLLGHTGWTHITLAIAEAYVQGGIDALADEIVAKSKPPVGGG